MANVWEVKSTQAGTTATYKNESGKAIATISGLASGLKAVDGEIAGIEVSGDTITLDKDVLGYSDVTLKNSNGGTFELELADDYRPKNAGGWLVSGTTAYLLDGTSVGYERSSSTVITYIAAQPGTETLATLTGLKDGVATDAQGQIKGIDFTNSTVTINSKSVLDKGTVSIEGSYKLAVGSALNPKASGDVTWASSKGTSASFTTTTTDGYTLNAKTGNIDYVGAATGTVTLSGLKDATDIKLNEGGSAIVDNENGTIKLKEDVFNGSNKVTIKCTGVDYTLALNEKDEATKEIMAEVSDPVWNKAKNATKATYTQVAGEGYYSYGTSISKLTKTLEKGGTTITLATLSGLAKSENEWEDEEIVDGIEVGTSTIKLTDTSLVGTSNLTLGKSDPYNLAVTGDFDVENIGEHWEYKGGKATIVKGTTDGFEQKDDKTFAYVKSTSTTLATVTGLVSYKDAEDFPGYIPYDAEDPENTGKIEGLDFKLPSSDGKTLGTITVSQTNILENDDGSVLIKDELSGVKKLTLGAKDNYKFVLDTDEESEYGKVQEPTDDPKGAEWNIGEKSTKDGEVGTGTWTYTLGTSWGWAIDDSTKGASKTINFVAAKTATLATVSGLSTDLDFTVEEDDDGNYTGRVLDSDDNVALAITKKSSTDSEGNTVTSDVIQLSKPAVGGKKISLKSATDSTKTPLYTLGIDSTVPVVHERTDDEIQWAADKSGKAVLEGGKTEGYEVDAKTNAAINYTAKKVTALATLTGLGKNLDSDAIDNLNEALNSDGVITKKPTATEAGEITLNTDILANVEEDSKLSVKLGNKDNYKLSLGELGEYGPTGEAVLALEIKKNTEDTLTGNAIYSANVDDGYVLSSDGKTVTYATAPESGGETLATLSGFITDNTKIDNDKLADAITVDADAKTFTLKDASLLKSGKLTLKNGKNYSYGLAVADALKAKEVKNQWDIQGTKATYYDGKSDGYDVDKNGTSISYVKSAATDTHATITGLSKNNTAKKFDIREVGSEKLILITGNALQSSTSAVKLTTSENYKLSLYGVAGPQITDSEWAKKDATATITRTTSAGWTTSSDGKAINYSKEKNENLVTVSGLKKSITAEEINQENLLNLNAEDKTVTVLNKVLDNAKVTIKSGIKGETYTLLPGKDVKTTTKSEKYWTVGSGKATYYEGNTPHYALGTGNLSLEYKTYKADATLATVSGLKKTANASDFTLSDDGVITLKPSAVDWTVKDVTKTKVTLKGDGYTLAFDYNAKDDDGNKFTEGKISKAWGSVKSGKILYESGVVKEADEGFVVSADGLTAYYGKTTDKKTTLATLSGVKAAPAAPTNGVITITSAQLNSTKISLGNKDNYTLELASGVNAPTASGTWTVDSKGTATLKGTKTAGYLQTDSKTIGYTAATASGKTETLATIKGVTATEIADVASSAEISLTKDQVGSTVTVDGKGILVFDFTSSDYKDATITGSKDNDSIKVAGNNLTIDPAKGNDYVNLGGSGNTFVYVSGDGYDTIADFTANSDKISITKAKTDPTATRNGDDFVIAVDKGSITLENFQSNEVTVNVNGTDKKIAISSSDLLLDDNYSTAATDDLSSIIKADTGSYTPYQFNDALKLTKEESYIPQIAYTSDKK